MNKLFELRPISDPPKEDGRYFVINDGGYKDMLTYENGGWIDCDMYSGDWLITDPPKFYLAPLAKPVEGMRWTKITDKNSFPPEDHTGKKYMVKYRFWSDYDESQTSDWECDMVTEEDMHEHCQGVAEYYWLDESASSAKEAELERECERLKGLIQPAFIAGLSVDEDDPVGDSWHAFRKQHNL